MDLICLLFSHLSCVWVFLTSWTAIHQASLSFTISLILLKLMSIESVMPSDHLILYCPLVLLPSIFPSMRLFANESVLRIRWPKYRSFNFSIIPCNEYSVFISFRIDWFDLIAVHLHWEKEATVWTRYCVLIALQIYHPSERHLITVCACSEWWCSPY